MQTAHTSHSQICACSLDIQLCLHFWRQHFHFRRLTTWDVCNVCITDHTHTAHTHRYARALEILISEASHMQTAHILHTHLQGLQVCSLYVQLSLHFWWLHFSGGSPRGKTNTGRPHTPSTHRHALSGFFKLFRREQSAQTTHAAHTLTDMRVLSGYPAQPVLLAAAFSLQGVHHVGKTDAVRGW